MSARRSVGWAGGVLLLALALAVGGPAVLDRLRADPPAAAPPQPAPTTTAPPAPSSPSPTVPAPSPETSATREVPPPSGGGGLRSSADGFTLHAAALALPAGPDVPFRFRITGPDGAPLERYAVTHEKQMHLIFVRQDLTGFQHVHPTREQDGGWTVDLDTSQPGPYRAFADFRPEARADPLVLGVDVVAAGDYLPAALPAPAPVFEVEGYTVSLEAAPDGGPLTFAVERRGRPVRDLEPYLGALGHLVALRRDDLAYLHTHPLEARSDGPGTVSFAASFPTASTYRLFLNFQHDGQVRTAEFTLDAAQTGGESGHAH